jgi:hypothetical protein
MDSAKRKAHNEVQLAKIDKSIRRQVQSVLATLEFYGHSPIIHASVWRSEAEQLAMVRRGVSKAKWGPHCASVDADGNPLARGSKAKPYPGSLAADIVCAEKGWGATREFWLTLGYAAKAQGLNWGGYWFTSRVSPTQRDRFKKRLVELFEYIASKRPIPDEKIFFGWDVAHVETARVTYAEAAQGNR